MRPNPLIVIPLVAALAACDRGSADLDPGPNGDAPATGEKVSIIRDDVGIEREPAAPLAPLEIVIGFPEGGSDLSAAAVAALRDALVSKQMKAGGPITLAGHTDSAGLDTANLRAAQGRGDAVRDWLVEHGVDESRISVIAFGEQNPVAPNARADGTPDPAGRARNRRVEMTITAPPGTPSADPTGKSETLVDEIAGAGED